MGTSCTRFEKIKILSLITGLNAGGAERALASLVQASDAHEFSHTVVSMMDLGVVGRQLASSGVEVFTLGMKPGVPSLFGLFRFLKILRRSRPHLLQCWMYHANVLGLVAGRLAGVPNIIWGIRCSDMDFSRYRRMTRWVVRFGAWLSRFPQSIIVNSDAGKRQHVIWGYDKSKMEVIPNGFDLELFKPDPEARTTVRKDLGLPDNALLIGLVARFDPMKDHATFLKAARLLSDLKPSVHYMLVGSGVCPENPEFSRLVRAIGLSEFVHLLGLRDDIPRITASLDIACSSSFGEGFSNALGEAMSCGVPCVATEVGDSASIVGDTGRIVPPKNPEAMAAALTGLIEIGQAGRRELGRKARQRIEENFSLAKMVRSHELIYEQLGSRFGSETTHTVAS